MLYGVEQEHRLRRVIGFPPDPWWCSSDLNAVPQRRPNVVAEPQQSRAKINPILGASHLSETRARWPTRDRPGSAESRRRSPAREPQNPHYLRKQGLVKTLKLCLHQSGHFRDDIYDRVSCLDSRLPRPYSSQPALPAAPSRSKPRSFARHSVRRCWWRQRVAWSCSLSNQ